MQAHGERGRGNQAAGRVGHAILTLLGQTVDAWRDPEGSGGRFCDLLDRVADETPRVWFTTSHPSNMEDRTLRLIGKKRQSWGGSTYPCSRVQTGC
jgi:tRNA A37 methylthiotransferase MiaB